MTHIKDENYLSEKINDIYVDIDNNMDKLVDLFYELKMHPGEPITNEEIKEATGYVKNILKDLENILTIVNDTINEYYHILNSQIDLLDIDSYHELRQSINDVVKSIKEDLEYLNIDRAIKSLVGLEKNIKKRRNPSDVYKMIENIDLRLRDIYLVPPESFILEGELIV